MACFLDDNNVVSKDAGLAAALGLECGRPYAREELIKSVALALDESIFEDSCQECRWHEEGICDYSLLRRRYRELAYQCG